MKTTVKKKIPKKYIVTVSVVLLLVVSSFLYVYAFNGNILGWKASNNRPAATTKQQQADSKAKSSSNSDITPAPTTIPGSDKKDVQVTITSANQNESTLQIRALIGAVEDTGVCTLTLTSTGKTPVTKTANVQALASTSTCQGFDMPVSELSTGTWHLHIEYSSSALIGSASQDIVIK
jgi:hypothetical protein